MNERRMRAMLICLTVVMIDAVAAFLLTRPGEERRPLPRDTRALARRLAQHPTDWEAASAIAERALDDNIPHRVEAWKAARAVARALSPHSETPNNAFARVGFFHWNELGDADRREVLTALEPMLRTQTTFSTLYQPLFEVTGDLAMLRRAQPHTEASIAQLCALALANGRFADYRELRAELNATSNANFSARVATLEPSGIVQQLPAEPHFEQEPLLRTALAELHRRPLEVDPEHPQILDGLIDYATKHHLGPLDGLAMVANEKWASDASRAALMRALGDAEHAANLEPGQPARPTGEVITINGVAWMGVCGGSVCGRARAEVDGPLPITIEPVASDEVPPYVEVYIDEKLAGEGEVTARRIVATVPPGHHRIEVRLANPQTRNRESRRIRIV